MIRRRTHLAGIIGAALCALAFSAAATTSASAAACSPTTGATSCTIAGSATLSAGSLTIEAPATLSWAATLSGYNQYVDDAATLTPIDATGSNSGWDAEVTSTTFTSGSHTLPNTSLTVNGSGSSQSSNSAPAASCASGSTCTTPTSTTAPVTYPMTVPANTSAPAAQPLYTADANTGEGAVNLASDWWVAIPSTATPGTYTNTITLSIVSGP